MQDFYKFQRNYLEQFGYLKKGQPEVGNLLMGDVSHFYEDEFRIAIKTLQVSTLLELIIHLLSILTYQKKVKEPVNFIEHRHHFYLYFTDNFPFWLICM